MTSPARFLVPLALSAFAVALLWAYWPAATAMADKWSTDPQYSHGFLVPLFAAYLLWHRRHMVPKLAPPASGWGLAVLGCGIGLQLAGAYFYIDAVTTVSLIPILLGLCLMCGGWPILRWAWPSIAFLIFMVPLPFRLEVALSHPLQRLATFCSTYMLQTLGLAAVAEGNIIVLDNAQIGVIDACNGLGMLVTFVAMTAATVLVTQRTLVEKLLIALSAIPIALVANVSRITLTGILLTTVGDKVAEVVYHDLAGWLMMPLALGLLWIQCKLLSFLLVEPEPEGLPQIGLGIPQLALTARAEPKTEASVV
jgi:exosortase